MPILLVEQIGQIVPLYFTTPTLRGCLADLRGAAHVVDMLPAHALVGHVHVLAHHVAELVLHQLAMQVCQQCLRNTIVEA